MKTIIKFLQAIIALGCIHIAATPFVFNTATMFTQAELPHLYFFEITGLSLIFLSYVSVVLIKQCSDVTVIGKILRISSVFLLFSGIGAVLCMWNNPFAYLSLLLSGTTAFLIFRLKLKTINTIN